MRGGNVLGTESPWREGADSTKSLPGSHSLERGERARYSARSDAKRRTEDSGSGLGERDCDTSGRGKSGRSRSGVPLRGRRVRSCPRVSGCPFHLEHHLNRLKTSAEGLRFAAFPALSELVEGMVNLLERSHVSFGSLYIQVTRGQTASRGIFPGEDTPCTVVITVEENPLTRNPFTRKGWRLSRGPRSAGSEPI